MPAAIGLKRTLLTLAATPNGAATELLLAALESANGAVRRGAARTLTARSDETSHVRLLSVVADCAQDVRGALADIDATKRLRPDVIKGIKGSDPTLCRRACGHAVDVEDHHTLATIVDVSLTSNHPFAVGLTSAALRLARSLSLKIEARDRGEGAGEDPAFVRRAALLSLGRAIDEFRSHERLELLDAYLMLTSYHDPVLRRILADETHAVRRPLLEALRTSVGYGAIGILIAALEDAAASPALVSIATDRHDRAFVERLLRHVGERPGVRVVQNVRELKGFAWALPEHRHILLQLGEQEQAAAVRLQAAADTSAESRVALAKLLMEQGSDAARIAACESLKRVKDPGVEPLLEKALSDSCPGVVAMAADQLRRQSYPNALMILVSLLNHSDERVVSAAQSALGEFSLDNYRKIAPNLAPEQRQAAGRLVGRADPGAIAEVGEELHAPAPQRRLTALEMISELRLVDRLLDPVIAALSDPDNGVRATAATALGLSESEQAIDALTKAMDDPSASVRLAVETSLRKLNGLTVAEKLLASLEEKSARGEA